MSRTGRATGAARLFLLATALTLAVAATAFDVPAERGAPLPLTAVPPAFAGAELGHAATAGPSHAPLVCVDPGHSLARPGMVVTVSPPDGAGGTPERKLREVDVNIDVALEVVRLLRARFGVDAVVMTWGEADGRARAWDALTGPDGDERLDVMMRGAFCGRQAAAAIVSIHTNWFGDAPNGTLTGYRDDDSRAFADAVHGPIRDAMRRDSDGRPLGGFVDYGLDRGDWFVTLAAGDGIPAVILEPVMMSNADEAGRLLAPIAEEPFGRRAQIARVEAQALGDWIAATLVAAR